MKKTTQEKIKEAYQILNRLFVDEIMSHEFEVISIDNVELRILTKSGYNFSFYYILSKIESGIILGEHNFMPLELTNLEGLLLQQFSKEQFKNISNSPEKIAERKAEYLKLKAEFETEIAVSAATTF